MLPLPGLPHKSNWRVFELNKLFPWSVLALIMLILIIQAAVTLTRNVTGTRTRKSTDVLAVDASK